MNRGSSEAHARILIDDLLRQAGWDPSDRSQVDAEVWVKHAYDLDSDQQAVRRVAEPRAPYVAASGRLDYELLDSRGRSLAIIEAKREGIDPYTARTQALPLARKRGAPFIFLSNAELIYFWDYDFTDARLVDSFFSRRDLERIRDMRHDRKPLAAIPIPDSYFRRSKALDVRDYQKDAMRALDHAIELGKRKFLLQLPTGCGKTDLIALYLKRLFQAGMAERVLFLVDRDTLAKQALECLQDVLSSYGSYWLRAGMQPQQQQITVCLLQTMVNQYRDFTSGYFDVVIADECHRSIYGAWQTALTHFDALHIGLTATPSEYIERNTLRFYQCKDDTPDFPYSIARAIEGRYLVPYSFCEGLTRIVHEGVEWEDERFDPFEFERRFTNEDTNRKMVQEFDEQAWAIYKDIAPAQKVGPGKTIVYAITKNHAARLARYLNELHPEVKTQTGEDYAAVITSDVPDSEALIRKFKREDYPQIAVSVGMLDTGFDCPEVLHIVMCRFVRSPILYQQMRGRGTRQADHIGKKKFVIYDFFGNHEYFGDSDTDVFEGTGRGHAPSVTAQVRPHEARELVELGIEDEWLIRGRWVEVGPDGERIDRRDYVSNWERAIHAQADTHPLIAKVKRGETLTAEEEDQLAAELNHPGMYFNEENLRRAYQQHEGGLIDFIRHALRDVLGKSPFKTREERVNEDFRAWLVAQRLDPEQAQYLNLVKNRFIANGRADVNDLFRPPLSLLNAATIGIQLFGEDRLGAIIDDMNQQVFRQRLREAA